MADGRDYPKLDPFIDAREGTGYAAGNLDRRRALVRNEAKTVSHIHIHRVVTPAGPSSDVQDVAIETSTVPTANHSSEASAEQAEMTSGNRTLDRRARKIANPDVDLGVRAARAGARPGQPLAPEAASDALDLIARSAKDLFGSLEAARRYLDRDNFSGLGLSTRDLLARGRGSSIIARLDELRFGTQG